MIHLLELASSTWEALRSVRWPFIALPLLGWCVLSFVVAVLLGRMIRRADRAAGILDEVREIDAAELDHYFRQLDGGFDEQPLPAATRREPTRSGPFLIEGAREVADYEAQVLPRRGA